VTLRFKTPSVDSIDTESSAPAGSFCWFGAPVTPNYQLLLLATCLLKPKVLELLDPSTRSQKEERDVFAGVQQKGEGYSSPGNPAHVKTKFISMHSQCCQVSCWEHPDRQLMQKDRTKGVESQRTQGCKR